MYLPYEVIHGKIMVSLCYDEGGNILSIWTGFFWKDVAERVVATVAQVLIAILSVDGLNLLTIDVAGTVSAVVIAAVLVVLKALAANAFVGGTVSPASLAKDDRGV